MPMIRPTRRKVLLATATALPVPPLVCDHLPRLGTLGTGHPGRWSGPLRVSAR